MPSDPAPVKYCADEAARIRRIFDATGSGRAVLREWSAAVDSLLGRLYADLLSADASGPGGFCLAAMGGYGRRELFPYSDIDLLFLAENQETEQRHRGAVPKICRLLWDLRFRVSETVRTLEECDQLHQGNLEFNIALLDCRYLAGDAKLFARLRGQILPQMVARERQELIGNLAELTHARNAKQGHTIFHLEPNLKDAPGGLRDYHVAGWLALIAELEARPGREAWGSPWREILQQECGSAFDFLAAARCFLHYRRGRDDNQLTYELQSEAAAAGIGLLPGDAVSAGDWMRNYFRHARAIDRWTARLLDEVGASRSSLYDLFEAWRARLSNADFSVLRGRVFLRQPAALRDPDTLLGLFEFLARHGLALSGEAERQVKETLSRPSEPLQKSSGLWTRFREILVAPHAAAALRAMHDTGLLARLFPEFAVIDSLVVRDFYHRYTVDEHTFRTIENLHRLRVPGSEWEQRFVEILPQLEEPELLYLALLFHDVGKGMPAGDHVAASLEAVERVLARLGLAPAKCETVRFLIARHLEMSATLQRRDIFDPETIHAFADRVGAPERLKMLCLLTYTDIQSVNPEALTPWKAEMLWQLYAATANRLSRSFDEECIHAGEGEGARLERILRLLPGKATREELAGFLEGFPKRYLATREPQEIAAHFQLAQRFKRNGAQIRLTPGNHFYDLTLVTADRPGLFATLTGALAAWGMNIVKAEAFANRAGTVLDNFRFVELFRTLELNPSETESFVESVTDVIGGRTKLEDLMRGRVSPAASPVEAKVPIQTVICFDDACSSHSTLLELITQDRPGLLYQISSTLAALGCNIEVALIDTEGHKAVDVFYLTAQGAKLDFRQQYALRSALLDRLASVD